MRPRALPPGPGLTTRGLQFRVRAQILSFGQRLMGALRPLFQDLDRAAAPRTTAEKFAAGGLLDLPEPVGGPMRQTDLSAWLDRAEYPLITAVEGSFEISSGRDVLARALGAGARSVDVMLREGGEVRRLSLRLSAGITQAQLSSALFELPEVPRFDLVRDMRVLADQAARVDNGRLAGVTSVRPFKTRAEDLARFQVAGRRASRAAEFRARQLRAEIVAYLRRRAHTSPVRYDARLDQAEERFEDQVSARAEMAARSVDQEAHEAYTETSQQRFENLGVKRYKWISSRDERTRKRHLDMDGNIYFWDNPPEADPGQYYHPGERNNCRCTPSALEEDILAALEGEEPKPKRVRRPRTIPRPTPTPVPAPAPVLSRPVAEELLGTQATLPSGFTITATSIEERKGTITAVAAIRNDKGNVVGNVLRRFGTDRQGQRYAEHASFLVSDEYQGQGLGASVFNAQIAAYQRSGAVDYVKLDAATAGRYVWTKAGFEWSQEDAEKLLTHLRDRLSARLGSQTAESIMRRVQTPYDVARLVVDGEKVGKDLLMNYPQEIVEMRQTPGKIRAL